MKRMSMKTRLMGLRFLPLVRERHGMCPVCSLTCSCSTFVAVCSLFGINKLIVESMMC